ncbi:MULTISPECIES: hypothetical protein [unclassified Alteromonas]|uniref:hypothetical protein n=1 Tax=unclassified Alteromonas TaxID=2614992 RepID=UPI000C49DFD1|nr:MULTISPECIES: hypothetical protein [unclassified Alteromonas]AYA66309.1 hypothetical protein DS731_21160 [Alteromonas sp. RKMC-009]MBT79796.1 hypothetical protein [Alteromonadaceae bacterium]MDO6474305.1 hypothetical protein [Alteromonas sp. 1_MG-2023]MEC7692595.1 hypothetical protein [Pseudomonadota bacterium]
MAGKNSKLTMLGVAAVFVLPVMLAKLALDNQWFTNAATNKGELLQPVRDLTPVFAAEKPKWRIVYSVPEQCDAACQNAIYSIHQVWIALGRETDRVEATVLLTGNSDAAIAEKLQSEQNLHVVKVADSRQQAALNVSDAGSILLVDTLNNAMLRYPTFTDKQMAIQHSRDILADVKKLLKLSRIG